MRYHCPRIDRDRHVGVSTLRTRLIASRVLLCFVVISCNDYNFPYSVRTAENINLIKFCLFAKF